MYFSNHEISNLVKTVFQTSLAKTVKWRIFCKFRSWQSPLLLQCLFHFSRNKKYSTSQFFWSTCKERISIREELKSQTKEDLKKVREEIKLEENALENCKNEFDQKQQSSISEIENKKQELETEKNSMLNERNKQLSESKDCKDRQKELDFNKKINKLNSEISALDNKISKIKKNENKQVLVHETNLQSLREKESSIKNQLITIEAEIETINKESGIKYSESRQQKRHKEDN